MITEVKQDKATHYLARLNPARRGGAKWEPIKFLKLEQPDPELLAAWAVKNAGVTHREIQREKVKVRPISELNREPHSNYEA